MVRGIHKPLKVYSVWFDTTLCGNHDHASSRGIHKPLKVYSVWFDTTVCGNHDHTYSRGIHKPLKSMYDRGFHIQSYQTKHYKLLMVCVYL
jgi:transcription elongation factor Elf1